MNEEDIIVSVDEDLETFYKAQEEYEEWLEKLDSRKQEEYFEGTD